MSICVHGLSVLHMHLKHHSNFAFQNILHNYHNALILIWYIQNNATQICQRFSYTYMRRRKMHPTGVRGGVRTPSPWKNSNSLNSHLNFTKICLRKTKLSFDTPPPSQEFFLFWISACACITITLSIVLLDSLNSYIDFNNVAYRVYCILFYFQRADHSNYTKG